REGGPGTAVGGGPEGLRRRCEGRPADPVSGLAQQLVAELPSLGADRADLAVGTPGRFLHLPDGHVAAGLSRVEGLAPRVERRAEAFLSGLIEPFCLFVFHV